MNFINKHFRKSQCVKIIYFGEGRKHSIRYLIPKSDTISFDGKSFILNKKDFFIDNKNFITYIFSYNRIEPVDPNDAETLGKITPADLDVALNSRIASEILNASKNKTDINIILVIVIIVMIAGFVGVWYMLSEQINALQESLKPLLEVL